MMMLMLMLMLMLVTIMMLMMMRRRRTMVSLYRASSVRAMNHHRPAGVGATSKSATAHKIHIKLNAFATPCWDAYRDSGACS